MKIIGEVLLFGLGALLLVAGIFFTYLIITISLREQVKDVLWYLVFSSPMIFISMVLIMAAAKKKNIKSWKK